MKPLLFAIAVLLISSCAPSAATLSSLAPEPASPAPAIHQPTLAPTPTPGNPGRVNPTSVPLARPLTTEAQAIEQMLKIDAHIATWADPWSAATLQLEPGRMTIQSFPDRAAEAGEAEGFLPEVIADAGAVWRITITGTVQLRLPGSSDAKFDGVTYVISQRLGSLLSVHSGKPINLW